MSDQPVMGGPTVHQMQVSLLRERIEELEELLEEANNKLAVANSFVASARNDALKESRNLAAFRVEFQTREREHAARVHSDRERIAVIVNALRPLVELLNTQPPSSLEYYAGAPLRKAVREAAELLSIIDGQKGWL